MHFINHGGSCRQTCEVQTIQCVLWCGTIHEIAQSEKEHISGWTITKRCFEQTMALKHTGSNQDKDHLYLQYANACHAVFLFQGGIQWTSGLKQHIVTPLFGPWVLSCVGISVWICPEERSKEIQVQVFLGRMLNKLNGLSILLYLVCCTFWHLLSLLAMWGVISELSRGKAISLTLN